MLLVLVDNRQVSMSGKEVLGHVTIIGKLSQAALARAQGSPVASPHCQQKVLG